MSRKKKTVKQRSLLRSSLRIGKWLLLVMVLFVVWVDFQIIQQFEGRKWSLPAHVYARSLELYQGMQFSPDELQWELAELGYQAVQTPTAPGYFARRGASIDVFLRKFQFWDRNENARRVRVDFSGSRIAGLQAVEQRASLALVRLEPLRIGGIYPGHWQDRELVRIDEIPAVLPDALVAVEDRRFYQHWGVSPTSIARAMRSNLRSGRVVEGGSTITQQLVKNIYLDSERSLQRKLLEALMAVLLELHYSKREILETYINEVYLGQAGKRSIHGYGLASRHYFRKPLAELKLHQIALLVAVGKGASYYNPWKYPQRAKQRRDLVLDVLVKEGVVDEAEARAAKARPLDVLSKPSNSYNDFPGYLDLVKRQLQQDYRDSDLNSAGLRVFTNLDPQVQRKLETSIDDTLGQLERGYRIKPKSLQAAAVVVRAGTGEITALAGDRNAQFAGFNRALDARRPIGSSVKPAVYLSALERPREFTLATLISDAPINLAGDREGERWSPRNFDHENHGDVPLFEALGQSYNQATVRLGMTLGLDAVIDTLKRLGFDGDIPKLPSILLGSLSMSPLQVAGLYHTIAADGFYSPLRAIREVYDQHNKPLKRYPYQVEQRFSAESIHLLQYAMQVVVREGTGKSVYNFLPRSISVAGKTGTTDDQRDSWFSGFTGNNLAVVWVGRDDNGHMPVTGATGALQVWGQFMRQLENQPLAFTKPDHVEYAWVDTEHNELSGKNCEGARYLPFVDGSEPSARGRCARRSGRALFDWLEDAFEWITK